jgi:hypothetical protein
MNLDRHTIASGRTKRSIPCRLLSLSCAWWAASGAVLAHELSDAAKREVAELLACVEKSPCEFNRSGTWYSAAQARNHLQRKYLYLAEKGRLASAEDFVALAASKSSITGESYLIRCGVAAPVTSAAWLEGELRRLRTVPASPPAPPAPR